MRVINDITESEDWAEICSESEPIVLALKSSMPGRCKILSLFLVSPHVRIFSSANVPPQRKEWKVERNWTIDSILRRHLPQELVDMVLSELDKIEHVLTSDLSSDLLESSLQCRLKRQRNRMRSETFRDFEAPFPSADVVNPLDEPWWYSAFFQ